MNSPIYDDRAEWGFLIKGLLVMPLIFVGIGMTSVAKGDLRGSLFLFIEAAVLWLIFWAIFPRRYQLWEDHVRIVLGGPFALKIKFNKIQTVTNSRSYGLGVNFATKATGDYVSIVRKNKFSVNITPNNTKLFVEQANRAMEKWGKSQPRG
jgi:hypothetical protein